MFYILIYNARTIVKYIIIIKTMTTVTKKSRTFTNRLKKGGSKYN